MNTKLLAAAFLIAVSFRGPIYAQDTNVLTNGLVAFYQFNGDANDTSGNGNNGTAYNVAFVTDRFGFGGRAASFAGNSSSYITINTTNLNLTELSISVWINPTAGSGIQGPRVFSTGGYELTCDSPANNLSLRPRFAEFVGESISSVFQAGVWTHVVATLSSNQANIYLNGVLSASKPISQPPDYSNGWIPTIGVNAGSYVNDNYGGLIDDLRIYNRALSADEAAALYDAEAPIIGMILLPTVTVRGGAGKTYGIQYAESLDSSNWTTLVSNITFVTNGVFIYPDTNSLKEPKRFYRAFEQ